MGQLYKRLLSFVCNKNECPTLQPIIDGRGEFFNDLGENLLSPLQKQVVHAVNWCRSQPADLPGYLNSLKDWRFFDTLDVSPTISGRPNNAFDYIQIHRTISIGRSNTVEQSIEPVVGSPHNYRFSAAWKDIGLLGESHFATASSFSDFHQFEITALLRIATHFESHEVSYNAESLKDTLFPNGDFALSYVDDEHFVFTPGKTVEKNIKIFGDGFSSSWRVVAIPENRKHFSIYLTNLPDRQGPRMPARLGTRHFHELFQIREETREENRIDTKIFDLEEKELFNTSCTLAYLHGVTLTTALERALIHSQTLADRKKKRQKPRIPVYGDTMRKTLADEAMFLVNMLQRGSNATPEQWNGLTSRLFDDNRISGNLSKINTIRGYKGRKIEVKTSLKSKVKIPTDLHDLTKLANRSEMESKAFSKALCEVLRNRAEKILLERRESERFHFRQKMLMTPAKSRPGKKAWREVMSVNISEIGADVIGLNTSFSLGDEIVLAFFPDKLPDGVLKGRIVRVVQSFGGIQNIVIEFIHNHSNPSKKRLPRHFANLQPRTN